MRRFGIGLVILGWLCSGVQWLSPVMAKNSACTLTASTSSSLNRSSFTSFGTIPQSLLSDPTSYFLVECNGNRHGTLTISVISSNLDYATTQFQITSADSIFTNSNTNYVSSLSVPFSTQGNTNTGKVYYQVHVTAPNGKVLRAEPNYAVGIKADLILN
jgi:hypothetical protein